MADYTSLSGFEHVLLEESWVLDVEVGPGRALIELDVVLLGGHPLHVAPAPGEQHCVRRGVVTFTGVTTSTWVHPTGPPAVDATGERDWGHVDTWVVEGRRHRLTGDVGTLDLDADDVLLVLAGAGARDDDLLEALRAEAALSRAERLTGASDGVLEAAAVIVERGAVTEREASTLRSVVSDSWSPTAPLSERLLTWVARARA